MKKEIVKRLLDKNRVQPFNRLIAYVIDSYVITLLCNIPILYYKAMKLQSTNVVMSLEDLTSLEAIIVVGIGLVLTFLYLVILPVYKGQTLGKALLGIKIISTYNDRLHVLDLVKRFLCCLCIEGVMLKPSILIQQYIIMFINKTLDVSYIFLALTLLSVGYSMFNKDQLMLHDLFSKTRVIKKEKND